MAGEALREALVGPPPGANTLRPMWVRPEDLAGCVACDTKVDLADVCAAVSEFMFLLSGSRYKQQYVTIRPKPRVETLCWARGYVDSWSIMPVGWSFDDDWALTLPDPVQTIVQVKVDGRVLDPGEYAVYSDRYLVRRDPNGDGRLAWPADQRLDLDDDQSNTFSVTVVYGDIIPVSGQFAARAWGCYLASQMAKLQGEGNCQLPSNVTQMVRQGVTISKLSPIDFLKDGKTGIDLVDEWINVVNPRGLRRRPLVMSPDTMEGVTQ